MPKSRWDRSFESDKSAEGSGDEEKEKKKKKEKVRKRERSLDQDQNQNQNKAKKVVRSEIVNILNLDVNEASTDDEEEKLEASSTKRQIVESAPKEGSLALSLARAGAMSAGHRKYAGALIPLPYIVFPRAAMFYSCTVCPAETTFTNLAQFEKHRESDQHRLKYGEKFRANNCQQGSGENFATSEQTRVRNKPNEQRANKGSERRRNKREDMGYSGS